jgi:S-adenosyl methyltransferase
MLEQVGTAHARDWRTNMAYFEGLELVDPGVVYLHEWRPHEVATKPRGLDKIFVGGIGRKPVPET